MRAFAEPLRVEDVPDPEPAPDGVVVRVRATGVCRSDWHGWMGHDPAIELPHVPGHELAGEVAAAGPQVRGFAVGDRVTVPFCCGCGRCEPCRGGHTQICDRDFQPGFTAWGSFAELVALPRADLNLVRLPDALGYVEAASLGCRFMTAFAAVTEHGRVSAGDWVAVHGCGGVGLSALMVATALGAAVVAVDVDDETLALARSAPPTRSTPAPAIRPRRSPSSRAGAPMSRSTRSAAPPPARTRSAACASAAATCRSASCSRTTAVPRSRWTG